MNLELEDKMVIIRNQDRLDLFCRDLCDSTFKSSSFPIIAFLGVGYNRGAIHFREVDDIEELKSLNLSSYEIIEFSETIKGE